MTYRNLRRNLLLALTLCGLLMHGATAMAAHASGGGAGGAGGESTEGGGRQAPGGSYGEGTGQTAQPPLPIKLQKLLERHHLTHSRILDAEIDRKDGQWVYELKLLGPDGVVRELRYNAINGDALTKTHD